MLRLLGYAKNLYKITEGLGVNKITSASTDCCLQSSFLDHLY